MRKYILLVIIYLSGMLATQSLAQAPVITSFSKNGELSWTNAVNSNAIYRVEWAAQPGGPWYTTFQRVQTLDAHSNTAFTVSVPMFYRVVMVTNEPPQGMIWIDGGDIELGQADIPSATPVHTNFVGGFWMDETEVNKAKWDEVYNWALTNGYSFDNSGAGKTNNHPVQSVSWYDCVKWCNARSQKEGLTPAYYTNAAFLSVYATGRVDIQNAWVKWTNGGYRLPTEAEWEKAARGGRQRRKFPSGSDTITHSFANYLSHVSYTSSGDISPTRGYHPLYSGGTVPHTSPCGSFPANGYGLHDTAGNVYEWCWDWFDNYAADYQVDPHGPESGSLRVSRGGSWGSYVYALSCASRDGHGNLAPETTSDTLGFRCVRGD